MEAQLASLAILALATVAAWLLMAWAISRSARAIGSPRARFGIGLVALLLAGIVAAAIAATAAVANPISAWSERARGAAVAIAQLIAVFFILRSAFNVSVGRAFVLFAVYLGFGVVQLMLVMFVLKPFVVEAFVIPTRSMAPTLDVGDRFVVNKLSHPRRLNLVAYWGQSDPPAIYCKRLIGLPNETLRFDGGQLFVNNQPIAMPAVLAGRCHAAVSAIPTTQARYRDGESITLGKDQYFMIGDNVDISVDSRMNGPSPASSIVGVVDFIYWPLSKARLLK